MIRMGRASTAAVVAVAALAVVPAAAAPASATPAPQATTCRPLTDAKAKAHAAATKREATLDQLVGVLHARQDPFGLNGPQATTLQNAKAGITALDQQIQSTCYTAAADLAADAAKLLDDYRVYWLRVPQTHAIEAADRLAEVRAKLGDAAAKLAPHVGSNAKAATDLQAMNASLAAADAMLGTAPTPAPAVAAVTTLQPAHDMTADDNVLNAARADLQAARAALVDARNHGLATVADLRG